MNTKKEVSSVLYDKSYFLTDNEGCREYEAGLEKNIHPKFDTALKIANPKRGDAVLDIGCGRGELLYYTAKRGARALGIDYSRAAIEIAEKTIERLPENLRRLAKAEVGDIVTYGFEEKYDIIFMIETAEHMYDWQLEEAFGKVKSILKNTGCLIILTPNHYYEKYLSPIKLIMNIPLNLFKWPLRILRNKYKPKNPGELLQKIFRIKIDRGELNNAMHVNVTTPVKLKTLLSEFDTEIKCLDNSKNFISLLTQKWWGRDIMVVAKLKK